MPMARIGLRDVFGESGDPEQLFAAYGHPPTISSRRPKG